MNYSGLQVVLEQLPLHGGRPASPRDELDILRINHGAQPPREERAAERELTPVSKAGALITSIWKMNSVKVTDKKSLAAESGFYLHGWARHSQNGKCGCESYSNIHFKGQEKDKRRAQNEHFSDSKAIWVSLKGESVQYRARMEGIHRKKLDYFTSC